MLSSIDVNVVALGMRLSVSRQPSAFFGQTFFHELRATADGKNIKTIKTQCYSVSSRRKKPKQTPVVLLNEELGISLNLRSRGNSDDIVYNLAGD